MNRTHFDIIGDIHGQAAKLRELLTQLGYHETDGIWRHESRQALFVGDFIDRGPAIPETLRMVSSMVREGTALAVMGNHELDALRFATAHSRFGYLKSQLEATHTQFNGRDAEWQIYLEWFRTLPLALDLGPLRIVHAAWNDDAVKTLGRLPLPYDDDALQLLIDESTKEGHAAEVLTNGVRLTLSGDDFVLTHRGVPLNWMRSKWWIPSEGQFYDDLSFPELDVVPRKLVTNKPPKPSAPEGLYGGYPAGAVPVFFGHYSLPASATPSQLAPNIACLDYSAWKGGPLVAYRWNGEQELDSSKFLQPPS